MNLSLTFDLQNGISGFFWPQCSQVVQCARYHFWFWKELLLLRGMLCMYYVFIMYNVEIWCVSL